jgi:hypothetical protein
MDFGNFKYRISTLSVKSLASARIDPPEIARIALFRLRNRKREFYSLLQFGTALASAASCPTDK